jgi:homoserine kinase type II
VWRLQFVNVYLLWHRRPLEGQEGLDPEMNYIETDDKFCGAFSTDAKADAGRQQLLRQPGFRDYPNDFYVGTPEVDKLEWTEGFVTD